MMRRVLNQYLANGNKRNITQIEECCAIGLFHPQLEIPECWDLSFPVICNDDGEHPYIKAFYYKRNKNEVSSPKGILSIDIQHFDLLNPPVELSIKQFLLADDLFPSMEYSETTHDETWDETQDEEKVWYSMLFLFSAYDVLKNIYRTNTWRKAQHSRRILKQELFSMTPLVHHPYYRAMNPDFFEWLEL